MIRDLSLVIAAAVVLGSPVSAQRGSSAPAGPPVEVTVNGRTWTQQQLFQRNIGGPDVQTAQFPPHKIVGNLYYVGTASLASYLVVTPQGNVLINSTYERNVPVILISHNLQDVFAVADRIIIMRRGRQVGDLRANATNSDQLVSLMVGATS